MLCEFRVVLSINLNLPFGVGGNVRPMRMTFEKVTQNKTVFIETRDFDDLVSLCRYLNKTLDKSLNWRFARTDSQYEISLSSECTRKTSYPWINGDFTDYIYCYDFTFSAFTFQDPEITQDFIDTLNFNVFM